MSTELVHQPQIVGSIAPVQPTKHWSENPELVKVVKDVAAPGTTDMELRFFMEVCKRTGLDPFAKQIYCVKRGSGDEDEGGQSEKKMTIQTGIDGFRAVAERTGKYRGQVGPFWCGKDGTWTDVWMSDNPPLAAKVGILRSDFAEPMWGVAHYSEYVQMNRYKKATRMWSKMPANQLAKCAEALGLRKAFPNDLSGIYTADEMAQADNPAEDAGSAEAAQRVADKKPEEMRKPKEATQPADPPKRTRPLTEIDAELLDKVQAVADYIGTEHTYRILAKHGGEHPVELIDKNAGAPVRWARLKAAYDEMLQVQKLMQEAEEKDASGEPITDDRDTWVPEEIGGKKDAAA